MKSVFVMLKALTHADWIDSIVYTKKYLLDVEPDDYDELLKSYNNWIIMQSIKQKCISDLFILQKFNFVKITDKKMHYDYLFHAIQQQNFNTPTYKSHYKKPEHKKCHVDAIKKYYGYSNDKALQAIKVLTTKQIHEISYSSNKSKGGYK